MRGMLLILALSGCASKSTPIDAPADAPGSTEMDHDWLDLPRHRITVRGTELAVFDTGGEGAPVVLVHGLGSTSAFWQKQLTGGRLDDLRLIAVDLPGWGDSGQPDGSYTPSFYAAHLLGLLDALELERAVFVGHSMGGQAVLSLALDHPGRVERLVLSAPAGIETFTSQEGAAIRGFWTEERLRDRPEDAARASYGLVFGRWDEDVERLLQARMALEGSPRIDGLIRAVQRSVGGMLDEPVRHRLPELRVPVLYVYGSQDRMIPAVALHPGLNPESVAADAASAIPDLQVVRLEGAGHTPHHDQPEAFDAALRGFVRPGP